MKLVLLLLFVIFSSCTQKDNRTIITGNIPNLPDGVLYLYQERPDNIIDSVTTKNGSFFLSHNWGKNIEEPFYLGIDHKDKNGVLRAFCYPTSAKYSGSGFNSSTFFSDSTVTLNGLLTDFIKFSKKSKIVLVPQIKAGYQTKTLFDIDGDLFNNFNTSLYKKVKNKINEYPNSFHLLYEINKNRNSYNVNQLQDLLNAFKGKITVSKTFIELKSYNEKRINKAKLVLPQLLDENNKHTQILDSKYNKHLIIFWASWCAPCREEIPTLKKIYENYKKNIDFVSISVDKENTSWQNALAKENMPWKQLIINKNSNEYEVVEIYFQVSKSIPYIVLVDSNMKILKSHVGTMTEIELEKFMNN